MVLVIMVNEFLRGLVLGLSIAAPVGPIGLLCIRRTLSDGRWSGFLTGLGAATADAVYGSIAAFGLAAISSLLVQQQQVLRLVGGIFLVYLGIRAFLSRPPRQELQHQSLHLAGSYFSTFFLTLTNPLTILSFTAIFAGLGLGTQQVRFDKAAWLVAGVFCGSALWWLILSQAVAWFRSRLVGTGLVWINRISGVLIVSFGIYVLMGLGNVPRDITSTIISETPLAATTSMRGYAVADRINPLVFPDDHGAHPDFQTEWWYYTGNVSSPEGIHFGYQLTFFRRALVPPTERQLRESAWATDQAYLAHFALTDTQRNQHYAFERLERGAAGLAGTAIDPFSVWLNDWQVIQTGEDTYNLRASVPASKEQPEIILDLFLVDSKGPILQGDQGYSRKGRQPENASYYYSLTRLVTDGSLTIGNRNYSVAGFSWMDHEYSTSALSANQVGWDWFSIQLDNDHEIMLFQIRLDDGTIDPFSSGAVIAPDGSVKLLSREDINLQVTDTWLSPNSGAVYPAGWNISIPSLQISLSIEPMIADQELNLRYKYWEGAVRIRGRFAEVPVGGFGYVELTGYAGSMGGEF